MLQGLWPYSEVGFDHNFALLWRPEKKLEIWNELLYWSIIMLGTGAILHFQKSTKWVLQMHPLRTSPLQQLTSTGILDSVSIDFLSLESNSRGISNILIDSETPVEPKSCTVGAIRAFDGVFAQNIWKREIKCLFVP